MRTVLVRGVEIVSTVPWLYVYEVVNPRRVTLAVLPPSSLMNDI
jgi:hypothetical protein